jgi:hypothetical protein
MTFGKDSWQTAKLAEIRSIHRPSSVSRSGLGFGAVASPHGLADT